MSHDVKLPACERCRLRKVKCDSNSNASKCSACIKDNHSCVIVDPLTHERYTREAVREMQQKIEDLEVELMAKQNPQVSTTRSPALQRRTTHFVGDGSGLEYAVRTFKSEELLTFKPFRKSISGRTRRGRQKRNSGTSECPLSHRPSYHHALRVTFISYSLRFH